MYEGNTKGLYITFIVYGKKLVVEKLSFISYGLYQTTIKPINSYVVVNQKFKDVENHRTLTWEYIEELEDSFV